MKTTIATVVEKVRHDSVGIHLVHVKEAEGGVKVVATVGVAEDEPAKVVCQRVYAAISDYLSRAGTPKPILIRVKVGRVG